MIVRTIGEGPFEDDIVSYKPLIQGETGIVTRHHYTVELL